MNPFEINVMINYGLNIILSNKKESCKRTYSHCVTVDEGLAFADELEKVLDTAVFTEFIKCVCCGEYFTKQGVIYLLKNGKAIHQKCFHKTELISLRHTDGKVEKVYSMKSGAPEFDFNNFCEKEQRFTYAIQAISKESIHIYTRQRPETRTSHFCFTFSECRSLIEEIRKKHKEIENALIRPCGYCGKMVYKDQIRYEFASGELIHARCMDELIQSPKAAEVTFPAKKIHLTDCFGHAWLFPERYHRETFM